MTMDPGLNVLVTDHPGPTVDIEAEVLAALGARLVVSASGSEDDLLRHAPDADAILTCFKVVSPAVVKAASRLQVIARYGIGVDNIAVATATELGIPVVNVPRYCADEVAEHAIAMMLALVRRLPRYDQALRGGDWQLKTGRPVHRLAESTLGIVGLGQIGREVAKRALGLSMRVLATTSPGGSAGDVVPGVERVDLDTLLGRSDVVTLHVPSTPATRHLLDGPRLAALRRGAIIINCSRGAVVDLDALVSALRGGHLGGVGLDVFEPEPLPSDHPLLSMPDVIVTPHVAFYSEESLAHLQREAAENVALVLAGRPPRNIVNPGVLAAR
jgi:D-3-phosphoglycerate dehydrogenase